MIKQVKYVLYPELFSSNYFRDQDCKHIRKQLVSVQEQKWKIKLNLKKDWHVRGNFLNHRRQLCA